MDQQLLSVWPLILVAGLGPLIFGLYFRMSQVEAQLHALEDPADAKSVAAVAGCMIRGRSCRGALLSLYVAAALLAGLTLVNLSHQLFGWPTLIIATLAVTAVTLFIVAALLLVGLETFLSLEPMEAISRRKLKANARRK